MNLKLVPNFIVVSRNTLKGPRLFRGDIWHCSVYCNKSFAHLWFLSGLMLPEYKHPPLTYLPASAVHWWKHFCCWKTFIFTLSDPGHESECASIMKETKTFEQIVFEKENKGKTWNYEEINKGRRCEWNRFMRKKWKKEENWRTTMIHPHNLYILN